MFYRLALPPYESVRHFDGMGNFAVDKYYRWPFSFFYQKKLKMMVEMLGKDMRSNVLDFGCGEAKIFETELKRHFFNVSCADRVSDLNPLGRYETITCASVLEFVWLPTTIKRLKRLLKPNGFMVVASPLKNRLTDFYFKLIGDKESRHSHKEIMGYIMRDFRVVEYKEWFGLYFCLKATPI